MADYSLGTRTIKGGSLLLCLKWSYINVYGSNWLPRPSTFSPISPDSLPLGTTVDYLIDRGNG